MFYICMKLSNINMVNFSKKLVANVSLPENGKYKIYKLDKTDDDVDLYYASNSPLWKDSYYLKSATSAFKRVYKKWDYYTLENDNNDILNFSVFNRTEYPKNDLMYIETAPRYSFDKNTKRKLKGLGTAMMAFLAIVSKQDNKDLFIPCIGDGAQSFYTQKCKFKSDNVKSANLPVNSIDEFVKNSGAKIEIVK